MLKIRCSKIGDIMTGQVGLTDNQESKLAEYYARSKPLTDRMKEEKAYLEDKRDNPQLSKTCINYLAELETELRTGRYKEIMTPAMEKGIKGEEQSITLLSSVTGKFFQKNEQFFENEYITGTPDIIEDIVWDIKTSWNVFTFPHEWTYSLDTGYEWQLQGYMALTGLKKAKLAYCLIDAPSAIISREKQRAEWNSPILDSAGHFDIAMDRIDKLMRYDDIPEEERVFIVDVERDESRINQIYERVELCRKFVEGKL
jgi:hypothetical protein